MKIEIDGLLYIFKLFYAKNFIYEIDKHTVVKRKNDFVRRMTKKKE